MGNFDSKIIDDDRLIDSLEELRFFKTEAHPCSYLPGQQATTVFLDPRQRITTPVYTQLSDLGFRRSGQHIYKPMCKSCRSCIPIRLPVSDFKATRSQKRCIKRNADLSVRLVNSIRSAEHYNLYHQYIENRHIDGDMYPPSEDQFENFLSCHWQSCRYLEFRLDQKLISVAVIDVLDTGISAIYTFYDTQHHSRSLGNLAILQQIKHAQKQQLPYVYLGYWIKNSPKMAYKSNYRPMEILLDERWLRVN